MQSFERTCLHQRVGVPLGDLILNFGGILLPKALIGTVTKVCNVEEITRGQLGSTSPLVYL
jgi:hypothetical protein